MSKLNFILSGKSFSSQRPVGSSAVSELGRKSCDVAQNPLQPGSSTGESPVFSVGAQGLHAAALCSAYGFVNLTLDSVSSQSAFKMNFCAHAPPVVTISSTKNGAQLLILFLLRLSTENS
jgi:hypothetical protein